MKWSFAIGRIAGTEIRLHFSLVFLFLLVLYRYQTLQGALQGLLLVVSIFVCIALHELGHTFAARIHGIQVKEITLWPLGGLANLSREPEQPLPNLIIAAAGPLVNLLLSIVFFTLIVSMMVLRTLLPELGGEDSLRAPGILSFLIGLLLANFSLAAFNLLPIFPMDGGRIARASLQLIFGPRHADTILVFISLPLAAGITILAIAARDPILFLVGLLLVLGSISLSQPLTRWLNLGIAAALNRPIYFLLQNDLDEAVEAFTKAIQKQPNQPLLYTNRAVAYLYLGEYINAYADLDRALAINPASPYTGLYRGVVEHVLGHKEQALEWYERVIQMRPGWALAYANRGGIYQELGDLEQALADLNHAVALEPNQALLYMLRSMVRYQAGDLEGARADGLRAIQQAPQETLVFTDLGQLNMKGNLEWALAYYGWAIDQMPGSALPYHGRADAFRINQRPDEAIEDYHRALNLNPHNASLYLGRGQAYLQRSQIAQAASDFNQALSLADKSHLRRKARALLEKCDRNAH